MKTHSVLACHIHASFRTVTAPVKSIRWVRASLATGQAKVSSVLGLSPIGLLAPLRSLQLCQSIRLLRCLRKYPRDEAHVLGIPGITPIARFTSPVRWQDEPFLFRQQAAQLGHCAVALARFAGAMVIGTVRSSSEEETARSAGAHHVLLNDSELVARLTSIVPGRLDHIVEVAFAANVDKDVEILKQGSPLLATLTVRLRAVGPASPSPT